MPDAFGITPDKAQEILDLPIVGASTSLESGVKVTTHDGSELHLVGEIATKNIVATSSIDVPESDSTVPEWYLAFMDNAKLADPASLVTDTVVTAAWSPDGAYLAVGYGTTPYVSVYKRAGTVLTKLAALPVFTNPAAVLDLVWSPNGQYLLVAVRYTPAYALFKRSGDTFTKLSDGTGVSYGNVTGIDWAKNGTYIAISGQVGPSIWLTWYKYASEVLTALPAPTTMPTGISQDVSWSPDSQYLAVGHATTPFLTNYKRTGDVLAKMTNPVTLPTGQVNDVEWSPDGNYLALALNVAPYVHIYKRSGDTLVKLDNPVTLPTGIGRGCAWSPDGRYLNVTHDTTPFATTYIRDEDAFAKIPNLGILPPGNAQDSSWSPEGQILAVGHATTPFITCYQAASEVYGGVPIRIN